MRLLLPRWHDGIPRNHRPGQSGRVLAEDVTAAVDVPGFRRSAMDGYAVRGEDTFGASDYDPISLELVGLSLPGNPFVCLN